jgi:hypothetical protein
MVQSGSLPIGSFPKYSAAREESKLVEPMGFEPLSPIDNT